MSILDLKAETVADRLWLVSNRDGTSEIVGEEERAGRGGFAPAFGRPYRAILADIVKSLQSDSRSWLEFYTAYMAGKMLTKGPLGGAEIPAIALVVGAHTYTAYIGKHHKGHFIGFGGAIATITMNDGTVYESNNVWSGRDVPPNLRDILRDNATIKWER